MLTIQDNGCGFEAQLSDQVVQPFYTSKSYGTGLGLAVVQKVMQQHAGTLSYQVPLRKDVQYSFYSLKFAMKENRMKHRILIVEDDKALLEALVDTLVLAQIECLQADSSESAIVLLKQCSVDLVVSDVQMEGMDGLGLLHYIQQNFPQTPVLLMTAYAEINKAVEAIKQGAVDYLAKPFSPQVLLNQVTRYMRPKAQLENVIAEDPKSIQLFMLAERVALSDASVMIAGPSGSGKEVLAHYIHQHSERKDQPFIAINCAAIPENMLEATLFGYEKGAYTGAHQGCPGKFEQAQGGTLYLDEISEMDLGLQAKLLRVLQEKEVERLGSRKTIHLDVRVLATTNRDLKACVSEQTFREDLYYRLNVFPLHLPPLC